MKGPALRILVFGAHPDDCDIQAGGLAALYARDGHRVKFVSHTNGATGHHAIGGIELALRRRAETESSARILGIEYLVLDHHTGELEPTVRFRKEVIRLIREFAPDLVFSHRPYDYHPDHRYSAQLVQDAAYLVTVPNMCPLTPALRSSPVILYLGDSFRKPVPFDPDIVVSIDDVFERKMDALHCHASQFYEWMPFNGGYTAEVPAEDAARRAWLADRRGRASAAIADRFRDRLIALYGPETGRRVRYAEAFEVCEYGAPLTDQRRHMLFPFLTPGTERAGTGN